MNKTGSFLARNGATCVAVLFFLKAVFLGFFIVPLWDIPDEEGHVDYVRSLARFDGIPALGIDAIDQDIQNSIHRAPRGEGPRNWIAQHPPFYHLLAVPAYWLFDRFSDDAEWLFRAPRIVSAISGALSLVVFHAILLRFSLPVFVRLSIVIALAGVPMFSFMSAGTSHDTTVALLCALATLSWVRFFQNKNQADAWRCAMWLACAAATKMTALVFAFAMMMALVWELKATGTWRQWILRTMALGAVSLSLPGLWMIRQYNSFGNPFATASVYVKTRLSEPLPVSFFEYLNSNPVLEDLFNHFYGLFGWHGTGHGKVLLLRITEVPFASFSILFFCFVMALLVSLHMHLRNCGGVRQPWLYGCSLVVLAAWFLLLWPGEGMFPLVRRAGFAVGLTAMLLPLYAVPVTRRFPDRLVGFNLLICFFFLAVLLSQVHKAYIWDGRLRGMHGRYFYPLLGCAVVLLAFIAQSFPRLARYSFPCSALLLAAMEGVAWFDQAIPFFER